MMKQLFLTFTILLFSVTGFSQSLQQAAAALQNEGVAKPKSVVKKPQQKASGRTAQREDFVDLGLSVKWATCNIGASSPEQYGNYYAWGETSTKSSYSRDNSKWFYVSSSSLKSQGVIDGIGNLTANYDVAQKQSKGRMPTKAEQDELRTKCTWTWTSQSGVNGYKVTGPNGNSIFLPAAGSRSDTSSYNVGSYGSYWCSAAHDVGDACSLYFYSGNCYWSYSYRFCGQSVRPVEMSTTKTSVQEEEEETPHIRVEKMPSFPGGMGALIKIIGEKLEYPKEAADLGLQGTVVVRFVVNKQGKAVRPEILKSVNPMLDKAALDVVLKLPMFEPGEQAGKKVPVYFNLPVQFKLGN